MRYDIRLLIEYEYQTDSDHVRNILRLLPLSEPEQSVTASLLTIEPPPDERRDDVDYFGNAVTSVSWHRKIQQIAFRLQARVERSATPMVDLSPSLAELPSDLAAAKLGTRSPHHFTAESPRIAADPAISAFARSASTSAATVCQAVEAFGRGLFETMTYDSKATNVRTPPAEAFAGGRGVCQDFAQIAVAGLRAVGVPAGYVSGFLRTYPPPGQPKLTGVDAMHAWVAAWAGTAQGWVEYDPTNGQWVGEDYIKVAFGRDYGDVAPVKGSVRTFGEQDSSQAVDVVPLD